MNIQHQVVKVINLQHDVKAQQRQYDRLKRYCVAHSVDFDEVLRIGLRELK